MMATSFPVEHRRRARRAAVIAFLLLEAAAVRGRAENPCEEGLQAAEKSYQVGLFEEIPGHLALCLAGREASRAERVQAHALLAKAYLAMDEPEKARDAVSALLRADPTFDPGPPPPFANLVQEVRREEVTAQVASVSKTAESLREAPATVVVVTGEEIQRRGYLDLEELLYDLPGFDVTRGNGEIYSSFYQRGFRSSFNDRNLLLLDGVEQNELSSNAAFLSRQYALSNIERVEVVYGPASTMYGANAYTGVINVVTRSPEALIGGRRFGFSAQGASGTFDTRFADLTLAGQTRSGSVAWSATGRLYRSEEMDLSRFPEWDYNYDSIDYSALLRLEGPRAMQFCNIQEDMPFECRQLPSPFYQPVFDENGRLLAVEATPEGERLARELDRQFLARNGFRFSDPTDDWFFYGKLRVSNVTLGLEMYRLEEGTAPWTTELVRGGRESGSVFAPRLLSFYLSFAQSIAADLSLRSLTRYAQTWLDRKDTGSVFFASYANTGLGLPELIQPCEETGGSAESCPVEPFADATPIATSSHQLRTELSLVYDPSERFSAIGGLDLRRSALQAEESPNVLRATRDHTDLAAYLQAAYRPRKTLKLVAGGRLDYNEINNHPDNEGFGGLFNSRLVAVYTPGAGRSAYKAIYSEAFKDPSDGEKFSLLPFVREFPSDGLEPERVRNFELGGDWQPAPGLSLGLAVYQAHYRELVGLRQITRCEDESNPETCKTSGQYQNLGKAIIRGAQAQFQYQRGRRTLFGNYTFADPQQTNPSDPFGQPLVSPSGQKVDRLRIGDIASHHLNVGLDVFWSPKLISDLRVSYVGARKTGIRTTVPTNPFDQVDAYVLTNTTLSYRLPSRGATLQLIVDNLFDVEVYHPGVAEAGFGFASRIPQPGRRIYLRLLAGMPERSPS